MIQPLLASANACVFKVDRFTEVTHFKGLCSCRAVSIGIDNTPFRQIFSRNVEKGNVACSI